MSVAEPILQRQPPVPSDPYFYGFRLVPRVADDGVERWEREPLTEWDVLHPREGDKISHSTAHADDVAYLKGAFEDRFAADPSVLVLSDVNIYWKEDEPEHHAPDCAVVFGVRRRLDKWPSFNVATEGTRPLIAIEVTSPSTRNADLKTKVHEYYAARIGWYLIAEEGEDPTGRRTLRMLGRRWTADGWERLPVDMAGRVWIEPAGLWLGSRDGRVRLFDREGREIGNYVEVARAAREAADRAAAAEAACKQADEARRQAEQRAASLEERLRAMEDELRRTRGG
jgi:hypothetical protein